MIQEIRDNETKEEYPVLRINKDLEYVVLFTTDNTGVVVSNLTANAAYTVGACFDAWDVSCFTDFSGTVTLANL